jgi:FdhE protein
MSREEDRASMLEEALAELIEKKPYSKDVLGAFRPIMAARKRLIERLELAQIEQVQVDEIRFRGGVSLIRQCALFFPDDPWQEIAAVMVPAIQEGIPRLHEDLARFLTHLQNKNLRLFSYFQHYPDDGEELIRGWAAACDVQPQAIALFLHAVAQVILEKRAKDLAKQVGGLSWERGFCPICGAFPVLAVIRDKGQRWLHCSVCGHGWRFGRIVCPCCEHGGEAGVTYFYVEDEKDESVFVCEQCKRYILTVSRVDALGDADPDVTAIGLVHLDLIMQEKGFLPVSSCAWNHF